MKNILIIVLVVVFVGAVAYFKQKPISGNLAADAERYGQS